MMRTILHVLGTARPDSMSLARVVLASARAAPADFVVRAVFLDGDGPLTGLLTAEGVMSEAVYWGGLRNLPGSFRVWRYLRKLAPGVVHAHIGSEYLRGIAKAAGVRCVIAHFHDHGQEIEQGNTAPHSTLFADVAIATSNSVAKLVRGRVVPEVIYPCVAQVPDEQPIEPGRKEPLIGALSRLAPIKGHRFLVQAMPAVLARVPEARLEIAGDAPERERLRQEITRLGLEQSVSLLGWRDDVEQLFGRWRVFTAPSLMEGFGTSILEAAMRGLPIVASRVGGIPEMLEDGVSALLVPPADPPALAEALIGLLTDPARAAALGRAAALRARATFAPERFQSAMAAVYARL